MRGRMDINTKRLVSLLFILAADYSKYMETLRVQ